MVFYKEAAEKLRNISLKLEEYPLVIAYKKNKHGSHLERPY
jgi:hypothetical protein